MKWWTCLLLTVVAICALGSVVFFFSVLLSVFRLKHEGYPYRYTLFDVIFKIIFQVDRWLVWLNSFMYFQLWWKDFVQLLNTCLYFAKCIFCNSYKCYVQFQFYLEKRFLNNISVDWCTDDYNVMWWFCDCSFLLKWKDTAGLAADLWCFTVLHTLNSTQIFNVIFLTVEVDAHTE